MPSTQNLIAYYHYERKNLSMPSTQNLIAYQKTSILVKILSHTSIEVYTKFETLPDEVGSAVKQQIIIRI